VSLDAKPLVLVVDDEPHVRRLICAVLARHGWRTAEAADGARALQLGAEATPDLLITDYDMPRIKGIELADAFRGRVPDLPVIVVSGLGAVGQLATSRGYRFLAKPFKPGELSALVAGLRLDC
jgi:CheY-like chemotaxis protein